MPATTILDLMLETSDDWPVWYTLTRGYAANLGVAEYVDITDKETKASALTRPARPPAGATDDERSIYKDELDEFRDKKDGINKIYDRIWKSVVPYELEMVMVRMGKTDVKDIILALHERLAPPPPTLLQLLGGEGEVDDSTADNVPISKGPPRSRRRRNRRNRKSPPPACPLRDSWVYSTTSEVHICNDRSRFIDLVSLEEDTWFHSGNGRAQVCGFGTAVVELTNPNSGRFKVELRNAAYAPDFHMNILSWSRAYEKEVLLDMSNMMLRQDKRPFANVWRRGNQMVVA